MAVKKATQAGRGKGEDADLASLKDKRSDPKLTLDLKTGSWSSTFDDAAPPPKGKSKTK